MDRGDDATLAYVNKLKKQTIYRIKGKSASENGDASAETELLGCIEEYLERRGINDEIQ